MAYNTIKLKKYLDVIEEYTPAASITPGMLLELTSAGTVQAHSAAGQDAIPYILLENELEGENIDTAITTTDKAQVWVAQRGEIAYMFLAAGENAAIGSYLESNGAGLLQVYDPASSAAVLPYPLGIVAQALEALDLSTAINGRLKVRIC